MLERIFVRFVLNKAISAIRPVLMASALAVGSMSVSMAQADLPAAQVADLKQKLAQRVTDLPPIDGVRTTSIPGLLELRAGGHLFYVDAKGDYLIEGSLMETRTRRNLTEERLDEVNKVDFASLPLRDAVVWKNGNGKRRLVVFADPNCGYCKRLEKGFQDLKDVTIYTFMVGILGDDSKVKADTIWCLKDRTQAWRDWMTQDLPPARAFGMCATPLQRNLALAQKLRVNGTPAMFFEDGSRLASAAPIDVIEKRLVKASTKVGG
jgi:thiol:disulfide interchange protein DsbC